VFAGGCELDAAEGICADERLAAAEVLELLAALVDKSVLIAEHLDSGVRYQLPETLREFGQERLQRAGEYTTLRRRHRDWHEQLAARTDIGWLSPQTAAEEARLFREHANVRAAQDFCQDEPGQAETGLRIALHVWPYYYWSAGQVSEGRYRLGQALAGGLDRRGLAVAGDGDLPGHGGGGQLGKGGQPVTFLPGPAAPAGALWRKLVQSCVLAQPGRPGDAARELLQLPPA